MRRADICLVQHDAEYLTNNGNIARMETVLNSASNSTKCYIVCHFSHMTVTRVFLQVTLRVSRFLYDGDANE